MRARPACTRRTFLKGAAVMAPAGWALAGRAAERKQADAPAGDLPAVHLGPSLRVSRVLLDEEPFLGRGHRRYLVCKAMYQYYTDDRIAETMDQAAGLGVTAALVRTNGRVLGLLEAYRKRGGKLKHMIAEIICKEAGMESVIRRSRQEGVGAVFLGPKHSDGRIRGAGWDTLKRWLELIKEQNVLVGAATERFDTLALYEKYVGRGLLPIDFYVQTACPTDAYLAEDLDKALEAIQGVDRPVLLRRLMPADAPAADAQRVLEKAWGRLAAKDALCVGIFPRDDPAQLRRYCASAASRPASPVRQALSLSMR